MDLKRRVPRQIVIEGQVEVEALGRGLQQCDRDCHRFLTDAVARQNDDLHGEVLGLASRARQGASASQSRRVCERFMMLRK